MIESDSKQNEISPGNPHINLFNYRFGTVQEIPACNGGHGWRRNACFIG